jgi:hypothetical protein
VSGAIRLLAYPGLVNSFSDGKSRGKMVRTPA